MYKYTSTNDRITPSTIYGDSFADAVGRALPHFATRPQYQPGLKPWEIPAPTPMQLTAILAEEDVSNSTIGNQHYRSMLIERADGQIVTLHFFESAVKTVA